MDTVKDPVVGSPPLSSIGDTCPIRVHSLSQEDFDFLSLNNVGRQYLRQIAFFFELAGANLGLGWN